MKRPIFTESALKQVFYFAVFICSCFFLRAILRLGLRNLDSSFLSFRQTWTHKKLCLLLYVKKITVYFGVLTGLDVM